MSEEPPLKALPDDELFLQMAVYNNAEEMHLAEAAFAVIFERYGDRLYSRCMKICARRFCPQLGEDLFQATMAKVFRKADTYDAGDCEAEALERRTLAWMGRLAQNLLTDHQRNPNRPSNPLESNELALESTLYSADDFARLHIEGTNMLSTPLLYQQIAAAYETLPERTQVVLLETYIQRTRSPSGRSMRRGSGKLLADHLETTPENIRRIRHEGIKAINAYLASVASNQRKGGKQDES